MALILVFSLLSSAGPNSSERYASYVYRLQATEKLAKTSSKTIQNSQLRAINSSMLSILSTANQESTGLLTAAGLEKLPKEPKTSTVSTDFTKLGTTLDDARLNSNFDRAYARELAFQLATIRAEIAAIYKNTRSQSLKTYLEKTDKNIEPFVDQLARYNNSTS